MEKWRDVIGYEGFYQVSNTGKIRSCDRPVKQRNNSIQIKRGRVLSPALNKSGYVICALSKDNKLSSYPVHRLVAMAWLRFPPPGMYEINHIDGNKQNNDVYNLEWSNRHNNLLHAIKLGLMKYNRGENHHNSKFLNSEMQSIMEQRLAGATLVSLGKKYNVFPSTIARITQRQKK
jgi:hypothetical protein